jgi:zinc transport system ATP-binding protein
MNNILQVNNLTVKYGRSEVLTNVSFEIDKGDYVGIVGPNGSGKTTLIKAILGLIPIHSGSILYANKNKNLIGYLPQRAISNDRIFPGKVEEIVATGLVSTKACQLLMGKGCKKAVQSILESLKISDLADKRIGNLSGGQQQRVLLARALINNPELLILDEPTSALDPMVREDFYNTLAELNKNNGTTILLVSHDISTIAQYAGKILYVDRKLIFWGNTKEFLNTDLGGINHVSH